MKLLLDLGNSYCKWALYDGKRLQSVNKLDYAHEAMSQRIDSMLHRLSFDDVGHINAVSVLGEKFNNMLTEQLAEVHRLPIQFFHSQQSRFGITLSYADVPSYGADRYCALVAAHHDVQGDKIVIDCGTATTIDVINALGEHQGGLIMPGVHAMVDSLINKTSGIRFDATKQPLNLLADNTQDAVLSGCIAQMKFGVQGVLEQILQQGQKAIVLAGGAIEYLDLSPFDEIECILRPNLVLEGLQIMQD